MFTAGFFHTTPTTARVWTVPLTSSVASASGRLVGLTAVSMDLYPVDNLHSDLRVYFSQETWVSKWFGCLSHDEIFLDNLRTELLTLGFSSEQVMNMEYSPPEQQGVHYVSFCAEQLGADLMEHLIWDISMPA